jgi:hypothetical protein
MEKEEREAVFFTSLLLHPLHLTLNATRAGGKGDGRNLAQHQSQVVREG